MDSSSICALARVGAEGAREGQPAVGSTFEARHTPADVVSRRIAFSPIKDRYRRSCKPIAERHDVRAVVEDDPEGEAVAARLFLIAGGNTWR